MVKREIADLAADLQRRAIGVETPPAWLLGAGASTEASIGPIQDLFELLHCEDFEEFVSAIEPLTHAERWFI